MGGDKMIMDAFVDAIRTGEKSYVLTPVQMSLDSHLMAFAAERSRIKGVTLDIQELETGNELRQPGFTEISKIAPSTNTECLR